MSTASEIIACQAEYDKWKVDLMKSFIEHIYFMLVRDDLCGPWGRPMP